jgi:hypothetical protein
MPSRARRELESAFRRKLLMEFEDGRDHRYDVLYVDGQWVLHTKISTGTRYRELGDALLAKIAKQLGVTRQQLDDLVECPMSLDDWVRQLRNAGRI